MTETKGPVSMLHPPEPAPVRLPRTSRAAVITAAGVAVLATLGAYVFWFWALIQVIGLASEFRAGSVASLIYHGGFWDQARTLLAIFGAAVLTLVSWTIALGAVEDS